MSDTALADPLAFLYEEEVSHSVSGDAAQAPHPKLDVAAGLRFLKGLLGGFQHEVEIRSLPSKDQLFTRLPGRVREFVTAHSRENLYFGVATREGKRGNKSACREIGSLWTDIDFKATAEVDARELLNRFPIQPSVIVASGGGWHLYWLLKETVAGDLLRLEPYLKALATRLGGDGAVAELARIMRLPGSLNWKYDPPRLCQMVREDWDRRYKLDEFSFLVESNTHPVPSSSQPCGSSAPTANRVAEPVRILQGQRNAMLASLAGTMRRRGMTQAAIEAALLADNHGRCDPPLPDTEVVQIASSIGKYSAGRTDEANREDVPSVVVKPQDLIPNIWEIEAPEIPWAVQDILPFGGVTLLSAKAGDRKTWLGLQLSKCITQGAVFLDRMTEKTEVVYCDLENPLAVVKQRMDLLRFEPTPLFHHWGLHCDTPPQKLEQPKLYFELLRSFGGRCVFIFDTLIRFHAAKDENSSSDMARIMEVVRRLASAGAACLVFHHRGRDEKKEYRGSSDIFAAADISLTLYKEEGGQGRLESGKNRFDEEFAISLGFDLGQGGFYATEDAAVQKRTNEFKKVAELIESKPGIPTKDIEEHFKSKISRDRVRHILKSGGFEVRPQGTTKRYYQKPSGFVVEV